MNIFANSGKKSKNGTIWTKYHQACCDIFPQRNPRFESSESLLERAEVIRKWMRMIIKQNPLKNSSDIDNIKGYSFDGGYNFGDTKLDISYSDSNRKNSYDFFSQYSNINAANLTTENRTVTVTLSFNL